MPTVSRCARPTFTQRQYDRRARRFAMVPTRWRDWTAPHSLAAMQKAGGAGLVAILPPLLYGYHLFGARNMPFVCSQEELTRLCGVSAESVSRAREVGEQLGLFTAAPEPYEPQGQEVMTWRFDVSDAHPFALPPGPEPGDGRRANYFYFPFTLIYGGQWAQLTHSQRALYLAVGLCARASFQPFDELPFIHDAVASDTAVDDVEACAGWAAERNANGRTAPDARRHAVRLAHVSQRELARVTGLHVKTVAEHTRGLRAPGPWPGSDGGRPGDWGVVEDENAEYAPLRVYPSATGGAHVYHLRDHAPPWPFERLNARERERHAWTAAHGCAAPAAASAPWHVWPEIDDVDDARSDDLPF